MGFCFKGRISRVWAMGVGWGRGVLGFGYSSLNPNQPRLTSLVFTKPLQPGSQPSASEAHKQA